MGGASVVGCTLSPPKAQGPKGTAAASRAGASAVGHTLRPHRIHLAPAWWGLEHTKHSGARRTSGTTDKGSSNNPRCHQQSELGSHQKHPAPPRQEGFIPNLPTQVIWRMEHSWWDVPWAHRKPSVYEEQLLHHRGGVLVVVHTLGPPKAQRLRGTAPAS